MQYILRPGMVQGMMKNYSTQWWQLAMGCHKCRYNTRLLRYNMNILWRKIQFPYFNFKTNAYKPECVIMN